MLDIIPERVEFFDLINARKELALLQSPIILTNAPGTIRFLGALAVHHIFQILNKEFVIADNIFRVDDDLAGLFHAINLGYKNISYTGNSLSAKKLLGSADFC